MVTIKADFAVLAAAALLWSRPASAEHFNFTSMDVPSQAISHTVGTPGSLNDSDQVVGSTESALGTYQGFVWQNGAFTLFPDCTILQSTNADGLAVGYNSSFPSYCTVATKTGAIKSYPLNITGNFRLDGINVSGLAIAQTTHRGDIAEGLILSGNRLQKIAVPGSLIKYGGSFPTFINAGGTLTGWYTQVGGAVHGFIYLAGTYTSFDVPGSYGTYPNVIADDGTIGGGFLPSRPSYDEQGFVMTGSTATAINPPGAVNSYVTGIGPDGEVVGNWRDASSAVYGFIFRANRFLRIDMPGAALTTIDGVNKLGSLVGSYNDRQGLPHSFIVQCATGIGYTQ